jgi:hypothetical protein
VESIDQAVGQNIGVVFVALAVVAVAALVLSVVLASRVGRVTRRFAWVEGKGEGGVDTLGSLLRVVESSAHEVERLRTDLDALTVESRRHFKRIGLVRYNAFEGVAGHQSYSLCLLDENRNGVLLSSLVGTNFNRAYAVEIADGEAPRKLGDEELAALKMALGAG